jgi:hypothetical protein
MLRKRYPNRRTHVPPHTPAKASETFCRGATELTGEEVEQQVMDYLRERLGKPVGLWNACYDLVMCAAPNWSAARPEAAFYRRQVMRLVREGKVVRYYRQPLRDKIRINEGYANPEHAVADRHF